LYQITDLVPSAATPGSGRFECDDVIEVITSTVAPVTWDVVGGPGAIDVFRGRLIVSQTPDVHDQIRDLLTMLRKGKRLARKHTAAAPPTVWLDLCEEDPAVQRIRRELQMPITVDFVEAALEEVAAYLQDVAKINVVIDRRALNDVGIGTDVPITFHARDIRLEHALRHILKGLDLTYVVRDQVLLITTPEVCECMLVTRLYPVADVLGPASGRDLFGDPLRPATADELIDLITATARPDTWDEVGGPGSIAAFPGEDLLVVSQTDDVHQEVVGILTRVRGSLGQSAAKTPPAAEVTEKRAPTRLVVYFVPASMTGDARAEDGAAGSPSGTAGAGREASNDALRQMGGGSMAEVTAPAPPVPEQELLTLITDLIEPDSWTTRKDVYARALPGRLVIRHTDAVHRQIERLLERLNVPQHQGAPQVIRMGGGFF
jgi:hypothetical protein